MEAKFSTFVDALGYTGVDILFITEKPHWHELKRRDFLKKVSTDWDVGLHTL